MNSSLHIDNLLLKATSTTETKQEIPPVADGLASNDILRKIFDFLPTADKYQVAATNRAFLTALSIFDQPTELSKKPKETFVDSKDSEPTPAREIKYPLSLYIWDFANAYNMKQPQLLIDRLRVLNKRDGYGATPIITLGERGAYDIKIYDIKINEKVRPIFYFRNADFKMLNILVSVCGYDINYRDAYQSTCLSWIMQRYNPKDRVLSGKKHTRMIQFFLNHPQFNGVSVTDAFNKAILNCSKVPLDHTPGKPKNAVTFVDMLETKKVNLEPGKEGIERVLRNAIYCLHDRPDMLRQFITLLRKYNPDLDLSSALNAIVNSNASFRPDEFIKLTELDVLKPAINYNSRADFGGRIEDKLHKEPLLHAYVKANRLLKSVQDEKQEYKTSISFFGFTKGFGFSRSAKIAALESVITAIKAQVFSFKKLDSEALLKQHRVLNERELVGVLETLDPSLFGKKLKRQLR